MTEKRETPDEIAARVRTLLPSFLVQTDEEIAAEKERQRLLAASFTRAKSNPAERMVERGVQMEQIARANIELQKEARAEGRNVSTRGGANQEMLAQELERLAEGLALQGRYVEAADVHPKKLKAKEFTEIQEAIDKADDLCECPRKEHKNPLNEKEAVSISPRRELKPVFSSKHGGMVSLMVCDSCGELNARPLIGQASEINAAAEGAARAKKPVVHESHVLRAKP